VFVSCTGQPVKPGQPCVSWRAERDAVAQQVPRHIQTAVGAVVARVAAERARDAEAVEGAGRG
jgi:hypothetical protein